MAADSRLSGDAMWTVLGAISWRRHSRSNIAQNAACRLSNLVGFRLGIERWCNHLRRPDHGVSEANAAIGVGLFGVRDDDRKDTRRYCNGEDGGDEAEGDGRFHFNGLSAENFVRRSDRVYVKTACGEIRHAAPAKRFCNHHEIDCYFAGRWCLLN